MSSDETNPNANGGSSATKTLSAAELQQFCSYLLRVVPLATDFNSPSDVDELKRALNDKPSTMESIRRFLVDPQCAVFFVRILQTGKGKSTNPLSISEYEGEC